MDGYNLRCDGKSDCPGNEDETDAECKKKPEEGRDLLSIQNKQGFINCEVPKEEGKHHFVLTCQHVYLIFVIFSSEEIATIKHYSINCDCQILPLSLNRE